MQHDGHVILSVSLCARFDVSPMKMDDAAAASVRLARVQPVAAARPLFLEHHPSCAQLNINTNQQLFLLRG